ncbi:DivIVA domain-containing protein [Gaopeijia maritima]|uniref:DivIVA domain-containing protein n=1 Tax=Gaopeijia maritima TaxID=3119007 RepID=UPI003246E3C8
MIDLTPLDVRKKRGDFKKSLRGYDAAEVDGFLELVAERMEELVKANITLEERAQRLGEQVVSLGGRERAVNEALVTAQQLRDEIRGQAQREADQLRREAERDSGQMRREAERDAEHLQKEAKLEAKQLLADAERQLEERKQALAEIETHRTRFLESYRQLLHRQMELVQVEESRSPLDDVTVELDLGGGRSSSESRGPLDEADDDAVDMDLGRSFGGEPDAVEESAAEMESPTIDAAADAALEDAADDPSDVDDAEEQVAVVGAMVTGAELDDDEAIPVEGLAPSDDDFDADATILPAPGSNSRSMA